VRIAMIGKLLYAAVLMPLPAAAARESLAISPDYSDAATAAEPTLTETRAYIRTYAERFCSLEFNPGGLATDKLRCRLRPTFELDENCVLLIQIESRCSVADVPRPDICTHETYRVPLDAIDPDGFRLLVADGHGALRLMCRASNPCVTAEGDPQNEGTHQIAQIDLWLADLAEGRYIRDALGHAAFLCGARQEPFGATPRWDFGQHY
jgi:hypothetical protein